MTNPTVVTIVDGVESATCPDHGVQKIHQTQYSQAGAVLWLNCGDSIPAPKADFGPTPEEVQAAAAAKQEKTDTAKQRAADAADAKDKKADADAATARQKQADTDAADAQRRAEARLSPAPDPTFPTAG